MHSVLDAVGRVAIGPFEGSSGFVVMTNVAHDFSGEIAFGAKNASGNEVALDFAKPDFNLVKPRGISRGVMQGEVGIGRQKFDDAFGFVGREIIDDGVNGFTRRLSGDQIVQKGDKLGAGVPLSGLAKDLTALGFQRGVKREGAMTEAFETVTLRPTRGERQHGVEPVESLDGALFIHAKDRGVERRLQIESDDIGRFGLEIGVVTGHVTDAHGEAALPRWPTLAPRATDLCPALWPALACSTGSLP